MDHLPDSPKIARVRSEAGEDIKSVPKRQKHVHVKTPLRQRNAIEAPHQHPPRDEALSRSVSQKDPVHPRDSSHFPLVKKGLLEDNEQRHIYIFQHSSKNFESLVPDVTDTTKASNVAPVHVPDDFKGPEPEMIKSSDILIVNPGHDDSVRDIPFPPHTKDKLFVSQIEGVRFMWREVVGNQGGALLAHTMGMGKSLQVITVLYLISKVGNAQGGKFSGMLPHNLQGTLYVLVLAPPGLLQNWKQEFEKWIPKRKHEQLLRFFMPTESRHAEERAKMLREWDKSGGVLLLGYQMFRDYAAGAQNQQKASKKASKALMPMKEKTPMHASDKVEDDAKVSEVEAKELSPADFLKLQIAKELANIVLERPSIVIADEAHALKNEESQLSIALNQIRTASRIALTGSPLANNLQEYYCLANWVAVGLLQSKPKFKSFFIDPIEAGMYEESTEAEKARSSRRLAVLREVISPKMHRRGLASIQHRLPQKTEFMITVELTDIQWRLYSLFAKNVVEENQSAENAADEERIEIKGFFDHVKCMRTLNNHPKILRDVIKGRAQENARKEGVDSLDLDEKLSKSTVLEIKEEELLNNVHLKILQKMNSYIKRFKDFDSPIHSNRMTCLLKLLDLAQEHNEKILVFSTSIPTLDYIEVQLRARSIRVSRIDGNTQAQGRQALTKDFNSARGANVMLISTRAGGVGLNITAATRVVIFDFDFSPQDEEQAIARAYRLGQDKPVFVYRLKVGGTFEDVIQNRSLFKMSLAARVVDSSTPFKVAKQRRAREYFKPPSKIEQHDLSELKMKCDDPLLQGLLETGLVKEVDMQDTHMGIETNHMTEEERLNLEVDLNKWERGGEDCGSEKGEEEEEAPHFESED
ncbi:hypothetical protein TWF694_010056 [Orbilia ellipsospora]|uniref:Uncharacterized protein n=1 Tax=Orbilia ellipsospora TaxID=2528407 RepID=A0AAV9XF35_9PEZI